MPTYVNPMSFGDVASKPAPIGADIVGILDSANNNIPSQCTLTQLLSGAVGTTQIPATSNSTLATTAFVQAAVGGGPGGTVTSVSGTANRVSVINGTTTPVVDIDAAYVGQASITTLGTIATGVWNGTGLTVPFGGTGVATFGTAYGTVCAGTTATGPLQTVSPGTTGQALISGGASALPAYGTLGVTGGGTGVATLTTPYGVLCAGTTATGVVQTLAALGAAGTILTSNGPGALPSFQAAGSSGALVYIATATASASATVDFNNNLSATYNQYLVLGENIMQGTANTALTVRVGTGAGPTYQATNYLGNPTGTTAFNLTSSNDNAVSNTARVYDVNMWVKNVNEATNYKTLKSLYSYATTTAIVNTHGGCIWQDATVITSLRFLAATGNINTGTFRLYGIKNS